MKQNTPTVARSMNDKSIQTVLRIDASASRQGSITRALGTEIIDRLTASNPELQVRHRDLSAGMPLLDEDWVNANLTDPEQRSAAQHAQLAGSDKLVEELVDADAIVLTVPIYNFSVPAALKAWIDQICRARLTFRYTEQGPQGLLKDRPVYLVMASGGVPLGSPMDFASDYLKQVFAFIGIQDIRLVPAERTSAGAQQARERAIDAITQWLPQAASA